MLFVVYVVVGGVGVGVPGRRVGVGVGVGVGVVVCVVVVVVDVIVFVVASVVIVVAVVSHGCRRLRWRRCPAVLACRSIWLLWSPVGRIRGGG